MFESFTNKALRVFITLQSAPFVTFWKALSLNAVWTRRFHKLCTENNVA